MEERFTTIYIAGYPEIDGSLGREELVYRSRYQSHIKVTKIDSRFRTLCGFKKLYPSWLKYGSFQGYELSSSIVPMPYFHTIFLEILYQR